MAEKPKLPRSYSINDVYRANFDLIEFKGAWLNLIGKPEIRGSWLIQGESGSGKTRFIVQLMKYLSNFGKILFDPIEEGFSESIKRAYKAENLDEMSGKILLLDRESIEQVIMRLEPRQSPRFVVIDSIQYTYMDKRFYKEYLIKKFPNKLFIFTSHEEAGKNIGSLARDVYFDSFVKMRAEGYRVFCKSRYGGGLPFDVWPEEAEKYHANKI